MAELESIEMPNGSNYDLISKYTKGLYIGETDSASTSTNFIVNIPEITELYEGLTILIRNTAVASASGCTINLNNLGAVRIVRSNSTGNYVTTHWSKNTWYLFTYGDNRWFMHMGYDTNTDTKTRQTLSATDANRPLLMSYATNDNTTTNVDNVTVRNNDIYANPSTGDITATNFNGLLNNKRHEWVSINDSEATGGDLITIPSSWNCQEIYILVRVHTYNIFVPFIIPVILISGTESAPMIFRGGWHMTSNNGGMVAVEVFYNAVHDICVRLVTCFLNGDTVLNSSFTKVYIKN